jgi:hypothetical protein
MVDRYSNIDLVFRNGLKEYEILPPQDVWDGISPSLKKTGQRMYWVRAAAVAAITLTTGILVYSLSHTLTGIFNGPAITLNQDSRPEGKFGTYTESFKVAKPVRIALNENQSGSTGEAADISSSQVGSSLPDALQIKNITTDQNTLSLRKDRIFLTNNNVKSNALIPKSKDIAVDYYVPVAEAISQKRNKWSIGAMVSPTYYSMFNTKSDASQNLTNSENAAMSYSGGLSFAFNVNKRISLQMGLYYSSLNHEIDGVRSYSGFTAFYAIKGSDNFSLLTSNGTITSRNNDIFLADTKGNDRVSSVFTNDVFDPNKAGLSYLSSSVFQNFNYIEVPFIIRYKVIDRTLGMNIVGGISYNQLLNNSAYAMADGNKYFIGSTDGLYPITLSSSFGVGMEYSLSKKLSINLEPTFRYYLTPMSGQGGSSLHPYTFGVFSGISYKF